MNSVGIGVLGAGRIGKVHADNLVRQISDATVLGVVDNHRPAAEELAQRLHISDVSDNPDILFDNPDINAVIIASPTDTHASFIQAAARAGKHIFCEKPIDFDLQRIDRALQAVSQAGVKFQIGFNRRFDPDFAHVQEQVHRGDIGDPHLIRISSRDPAPPPIDYIKVSGGLFLDMAIHDFDMARYLAAAEVVSVYATGAVRIDPAIGEAGDIDTAVTILEFDNGSIATIDNSRKATYGYDQRIEVFGSGGMAWAENNSPHRTGIANADGIHSPRPYTFFMERYQASYLAEMKSFVHAIQQDIPTALDGADGRASVVIGLAARLSLQEKRRVFLKELE